MAEGTKGTVVQVIGTVVDVEFPPDQLPAIYNAVEIDKNGTTVVAGGPKTLGRLFDVLGRPLDNLGAVEADERWPIHRPPPTFEEQETQPQILETGIKIIDLIAPLARGGKVR